MIERLIAARLSDMLERVEILTANQTDFRAGRSAEDQVLRLACWEKLKSVSTESTPMTLHG